MSEPARDRLERLFGAALELPAGERQAFLDRECAGDGDLRREVEELLAAQPAAGGYFDRLAADIAAGALLEIETAARPKVRIGPYHASDVIGRGGMGVVYRAERVDGQFSQQVAIKLLHLDMESPPLRARFLAERQLLARLAHPNIATLLDGGVTDEGRPYFVMEYVEGLPITAWCRRRALPVHDLLRLFLDVIGAVSYLHRNLVVHRDLKPSNILVDEAGHVKLLDFGIAKLLAGDGPAPAHTVTGERLLTPDYAAPEQLAGEPVTTATDVYALGTVLYELLTGRKPYPPRQGLPLERRAAVPTAPSAALRAAASAAGGADQQAIAHPWRRLAGDLDAVCLMALRPEPDRRYASAEQLGQDLERHLAEQPIRAAPATLAYRTTRFARRNGKALAALVALLALLTIGLLRERGLRSEAELAHGDAEREAAKALAVSGFLGELLASADPSRAQGRDLTVAEVLAQAAERLEGDHALEAQPEVEARVRLTLGRTYTALRRFDDAGTQLERALALLEPLGRSRLERLEVVEAMAVARYRAGELAPAETLLLEVLAARSRDLSDDDPDTLETMSHLANVYFYQGRLDDVEALDRRILEIRRRVLGDEHPDTLRSTNGLAATLFSRARYAEAAPLFERALAAQRRQLGESHPDTLRLANNLAATYTELGRYRTAEPLARAVAAGRRKVLGGDHPETATAVHNLALTLAQLGRYDEAEPLLREAIQLRSAYADPSARLFSESYLADLLRDRGRYGEAEALYLAVLEGQRAQLGADNPPALRTASSLAELRLRSGSVDDAEALIATALAAQTRLLEPSHPDLLGSRLTHGRILNAHGAHSAAEVLGREVAALASAALAPDHPLVLEAVEVRTAALRGLGRLDEASSLAAAAVGRED